MWERTSETIMFNLFIDNSMAIALAFPLKIKNVRSISNQSCTALRIAHKFQFFFTNLTKQLIYILH